MQRVVKDALISAGAVMLLIVAIVSIDDRVRERVTDILNRPPSSAEIAGTGAQVAQVSSVVFKAVRDQSVEHAPMVVFVVAAAVLVLFMLRT
jgi:hypothetical protein